jgi:hypothetical protein
VQENRKLKFGSGCFKWDYKEAPLENWEKAKRYYAKKGMDIGDFPVMTEDEEKELAKQLENIK